jgi:hypothetical protein
VTTSNRLVGALTGILGLTLLATPLLLVAPAHAMVNAEDRVSTAPNVFFPVMGRLAHDLQNSGKRPGTEIKAPCGNVVRAAHPGRAILSVSAKSGPHLVTIVTTTGRLTTYYGYMSQASVTTGQVIQAGQEIGRVGHEGVARFCSTYFAVKGNDGNTVNPSKWLNYFVGRPMNTTSMFGNWGFVLASFNTLGASHTRDSSRYATYDIRTPKQVTLLGSYGVDVVGLQEFQRPQRTSFLTAAHGTYGIYPDDATLATNTKTDSENSIIWRNSTMEFISAELISVPYFERNRLMPVVLLRQRSTGRTAYFINVHNPASGVGYGDQTANRAKAIAIERAKVVALRATGRPVFLTGDFNDRAAAFCPLTSGKLMITPDSIPSMTCALPKNPGIDWTLAAGGARFSRYARDWKPKTLALTDHPIVWTRVHLAE